MPYRQVGEFYGLRRRASSAGGHSSLLRRHLDITPTRATSTRTYRDFHVPEASFSTVWAARRCRVSDCLASAM